MRLTLKAALLMTIFALVFVSTAVTPAARTVQSATVDGIVVNLGVVPATQARVHPGESAEHAAKAPSASHHVLISLTDVKTGAHISGADVSVEVKDPRGKIHKAKLNEAATAGAPDYSGVFTFAWAGKYAIKVIIQAARSKRTMTATLSWVNDI